MAEEPLYSRIINENEEKGQQLRIVVNEFRDVEYLHFRKYYLSFDEGYVPTKEGVSMPLTISNSYAILESMIELCSKMEGVDALKDRLDKITEELENEQHTN
jgi:hypothetical protein